MVVYVRIEPKEAQSARKSVASVKEKFTKSNEAALKFDAVRGEEKRASMGIVTKVRAIEKEVENLKSLLPKFETVKAKEVKAKPSRKKIAKTKEETRGKTKYQEELEKIRKRIAGL